MAPLFAAAVEAPDHIEAVSACQTVRFTATSGVRPSARVQGERDAVDATGSNRDASPIPNAAAGAVFGSGSQEAHHDREQHNRGGLQDDPPLHEPIGSPWITFTYESDHAGDQHAKGGKHQDPDQDGQKCMHQPKLGCRDDFCRYA
jgi:hypothetical protein